MKAGWRTAKLEDLASFRSGLWIGKKGPLRTAKVIRNTNIRRYGELSLDDIAEIQVEEKQLESRRLQFGDIVLERSGGGPKQPVGRAVCFELDADDYSFSNFTSNIRINNPKQLHFRFLHLVLNWWYESGVTEKIQSNSTGIRNLDFNAYKALPVPLPPLEEQRRIVAILDEAFEGLSRARANAEANLQSARELFESYSGAVFSEGRHGWKSYQLEALVDPDCSLSYGIVQPGDEVASGLPIVRPTDLGHRTISLNGLKRIDPARASGYARTELKGGDLLLCVRGTTGVVSMAAPELRGANVTRGIVPIRFKADIVDQRLGYFMLRSLPVQTQIRAGTYGAALMQINIRDVRKIAINVPPRQQQAILINQLERAENDFIQLEKLYSHKIRDVEQLRQSLLQKALAGELTVREFA